MWLEEGVVHLFDEAIGSSWGLAFLFHGGDFRELTYCRLTEAVLATWVPIFTAVVTI